MHCCLERYPEQAEHSYALRAVLLLCVFRSRVCGLTQFPHTLPDLQEVP